MWRREKGLRREDILHAVPLVCNGAERQSPGAVDRDGSRS